MIIIDKDMCVHPKKNPLFGSLMLEKIIFGNALPIGWIKSSQIVV